MKINRRYIYEIDAGKMRHNLILIPPTDIPDYRGGTIRAYDLANGINAFCLVRPNVSERVLAEMNFTFFNCVVIYIRYIPNLSNDWQIIMDGQTWYIHKNADVDGKERYLELTIFTKNS